MLTLNDGSNAVRRTPAATISPQMASYPSWWMLFVRLLPASAAGLWLSFSLFLFLYNVWLAVGPVAISCW